MISVIGGTYREINYDNISVDIFGSGYRGTKFLLENKCHVNFFTSGNENTLNFLKENQKIYDDFKFECVEYDELITFKYYFALDEPTVYPNPSNILKTQKIKVQTENILAFGMLETDLKISGEKIVYDPQTSIKPKTFSRIGKAKELIYIVNMEEAQSLASSHLLAKIKNYFFKVEQVKAFIIKNGPYGATLYYGNDKEIPIPSFITTNVDKIGSGDIFTSSFSYYWMIKKLSLEEAALYASKSTAFYCNSGAYVDATEISKFHFKKYVTKKLSNKQVYLAAPFFAISELILIDKIRNAFLAFGVNVFSPFHDIGVGNGEIVAKKDIEGIESSDIIFCVFDHLDSGTLIEAGYSMVRNKKIIGYHRTIEEEKLLMLKPSNLKVFSDLTTAIYQTIWNL